MMPSEPTERLIVIQTGFALAFFERSSIGQRIPLSRTNSETANWQIPLEGQMSVAHSILQEFECDFRFRFEDQVFRPTTFAASFVVRVIK